MRIVVDTNVIVSALMNKEGTPARILSSILSGELCILFDERIIFEYINVLSREVFGFNSKTIDGMINYFKAKGEYINADLLQINFTGETDKKFYEVFKSGQALYLITGNVKHFPKETGIVTPRKFLESISM